MAIIRTIEGTYYDIADEILQHCRVPEEVVAEQLKRVHLGMRRDLSEEFGRLVDARQRPAEGTGV